MLETVNGGPVSLAIAAIEVGDRVRSLNPANVEKIRLSVADSGLIQPIVVWRDEAALRLCAGLHRLEACKALGWTEIPVRLVTAESAAEVILAECDENLSRTELDGAEEAVTIKARKAAYAKLHGKETAQAASNSKAGKASARAKILKAQEANESATCTFVAEGEAPEDSTAFIEDTVKKTGKSLDNVKRASRRANINGVEKLQRTPAAKGAILDDLTLVQKAEPERAAALVDTIAEAEKAAEAARIEEARKIEEARQAEEAAKTEEAKAEAARKLEDAELAKAKAEEARKAAEAKSKEVVQEIKQTAEKVKAVKRARKPKEPIDPIEGYLQECEDLFATALKLLKVVPKGSLKSLRYKIMAVVDEMEKLRVK